MGKKIDSFRLVVLPRPDLPRAPDLPPTEAVPRLPRPPSSYRPVLNSIVGEHRVPPRPRRSLAEFQAKLDAWPMPAVRDHATPGMLLGMADTVVFSAAQAELFLRDHANITADLAPGSDVEEAAARRGIDTLFTIHEHARPANGLSDSARAFLGSSAPSRDSDADDPPPAGSGPTSSRSTFTQRIRATGRKVAAVLRIPRRNNGSDPPG